MIDLSVVMPIGRVDRFLSLTLDSVEAQIYRDFELIVVCEADIVSEVTALIESGKYTFSRKIISTTLRGVAFAANLGIAASSGKYIARWDSDDLCDSNRFLRQIAEMTKNPKIAVIGSKVVIIDEYGIPSRYQKFKFYSDDISIRRALKYRQPLLHSSLIFHSDILFKNKGYLYGHTSEDHELFIRIARNKQLLFKNLEDVTTYYRRHSAQLSDLSNQKIHYYEISSFMFSEFLRTFNPLYIIGMLVNIPFLRRLRYTYREFLKNIYK